MEELDNLSILNECLQRSDTMTNNMLGILNSFENRLSKLEETIIPIYQETGNLQRRHENIQKTLSTLEQVNGYYNLGEEVEPVIREGPSGALEKYLECMVNLHKAMKYFEKHSPLSEELSQVTTLFEAGKESLEKEFRNILSQNSMKPVPPVMILDVLAEVDEDTIVSSDAHISSQLPARVHEDLAAIANWLQQCGLKTDHMQVYSTIRSNALVKSLQSLRDHLKSGSQEGRDLSASPSAVSGKPKLKDTPNKRQSSMRHKALVKKASSAVMKHLTQLEAAGLKSSTPGEEEGSEVDIDIFITTVSALHKLMQCEIQMMGGVIPDKHSRKVFDMIVQGAFDLIVKEGERISGNIKRSTTRHQYTSVISVFPVLKHLRGIKPEFDRILEGCQTSTRTKLVSLISTLDNTGAKALEAFTESLKNNPEKVVMPPDGTVHEVTSNTMIFLEQLLNFVETVGSMLLTQDPGSIPNLQHLDRPKLKAAEYITKVLSALGLRLNNISDTYTDMTLKAVFMLNNYNYILKSLKRTGLSDLVHTWNKEVQSYYEDQLLEQKRVYSQRSGLMDLVHQLNHEIERYYEEMIEKQKLRYEERSWSPVLIHIVETNHKPPVDINKLKDKERQSIKDRFTGFNREIEDIYRTQKAYAIPDTELRESLKRDNREFILPKYRAFLATYRNCNFTKNPEKYVRYSEKDVAGLIHKFFDNTA